MDLGVCAGRRVTLKESEKKDNYKDLARELKKITVIQIVIDAIWTIPHWIDRRN